MANSDLDRFRLKVREYRLLVNRNQSDLAAYLNLDYNELSNRLNSHKNARLSHDNVRGIVRALAEWGAITTTFQAEELLDLLLCPHFDQADLQAMPLSKLVVSPTPNSASAANSGQTPVEPPVNTPLQAIPPAQIVTFQSISNNLPKQLSSFIGRHKEITELKKLLVTEKVSLLTLVGAGGCGKTRLSLRVASELLDSFRDGVWFVELAQLSDPALIAQTIATALGLSEQVGRPLLDNLRDYLRSRQLLLVLDNCEHLVAQCARLVETLLHNSNNLQILASSREGLGINGEISFLVPSLTLPDSQEILEVEKLNGYEAISLFKERAVGVSPHFSLTQQNADAVVQLCRQLDGIPLAIELAAVRIKLLTVEQIAARLDDRFRLLTGGSRTALPRQQTLRALVDWSYELLAEAEKRLLIRLSVFSGGWTLDAAQAVCGGAPGLEEYDILDALTGLVNKSLVQINEHKENEEARYHLLETIQQYGLEKLKAAGEEARVRERHLTFFTNLAGEFYYKLMGHGQLETLKLLDRELNNMRSVIDYALKVSKAEAVFKLTGGILYFWESRGYYSEVRRYMVEALALLGSNGVSRGIILCHTGFIALRQVDFQAARIHYAEALALSKQHYDKELLVYLYTGLGIIASHDGNYAEAQRIYEESVVVAEEMGQFFKAGSRANLGLLFLEQGKYEEAWRLLNEAEVIAREIGNRWMLTLILFSLSKLALVLEDYSGSHRYVEETLNISEEIGYLSGKSHALTILGMVWYYEDKFKEARQSFEESLTLCLKESFRNESSQVLVGVTGLLSKVWLKKRQAGLLEQVACLCGAIVASKDASVLVWEQPFRTYYQQSQEVARSTLAEVTFKKAFERGQVMPLEEAIGYARKALAEF